MSGEAVKERPILMSAPMVRAILAGAKTQTRRVVKLQPPAGWDRNCWFSAPVWGWTAQAEPSQTWHKVRCPYGQPGDRLWVRESHYLHGIWSVRKDDYGKRRWTFHPNPDMGAQFTEPNGFIKGRSTTVAGWYRRSSIHMPRWASRLTLEVTGVRVERLQDISEADAIAEGIELMPGPETYPMWKHYGKPGTRISCPIESYRSLWEHINGPGSWDANPWVWVVEFRRLPCS